jgi:hypothetical protein
MRKVKHDAQKKPTLRSLHRVDGVTSTQTVVVLESFFERTHSVM